VIYGYARVSTEANDLTGQLAALKAAECGNIFRAQRTGARAERPQLQKRLRDMVKGAGNDDAVHEREPEAPGVFLKAGVSPECRDPAVALAQGAASGDL